MISTRKVASAQKDLAEPLPVKIPWTKNRVIEEIRKRCVEGKVLYGNGVRRDDPSLYKAALRLFHKYDQAILAARLNPALTRKSPPPAPYTREQITAWIVDRHQQGLSVTYKTMKTEHLRMLKCARRTFGTWRQAVEAAGVNYDATFNIRERQYASSEAILTAITERHLRGHSMRGIDVRRGTPSDPALLKAAVNVFGKWRDALLAAGIPLPVVERHATRQGKYQSASDVVAEIKRRMAGGLPINTGKVLKGAQRDGNLYAQACKHCGAWQKAVEAAGVDYASIGRAVRWRTTYTTPEAVLAEIHRRHNTRLPLSFKLMERGPHHDRNLRDAGKRLFGSWRNAIEAAGFDYAILMSPIGRPKL